MPAESDRRKLAEGLIGGHAELAGKIFRIGHMGDCTEEEIQGVFDALEQVLPKIGFAPAGAGR